MTSSLARAVPRAAVGPRLALSATALVSLVLLLAPHVAQAAPFAAKDSDAVGKWVGDAKDPTNRYEVTAGSRPGELQLISPAAVKIPPIVLHRSSPAGFTTDPGASPTAAFTLTSARHATVKVHEDSKKRFTFTYLLLDKQ